MSWLGIIVALIGLYLAFKLVGALLKALMWALVLVGAYWFLAPQLGWPTLSDLVYVLGPDFGGRRIEEVVRPSVIADEVAERVVDGVIERIESPQPAADPAQPATDVPRPEPLPEPLPEAEPIDTTAGEGAQ